MRPPDAAPVPSPALQAAPIGALDTTLVDTVSAGEIVIRTLPTTLEGRSVIEYRPVRLPARGWWRDRSFFWRTPDTAEGNYRFEFRARMEDGSARTVMIRVYVATAD